jgi:putative transposase
VVRKARQIIPGQLYYIVLRGSPSLSIFDHDELKLEFLAWLRDAAKNYKMTLHAYVILPNQTQILVTPLFDMSLARTMQSLCRRFTQLYNQMYQHKGSIWAGRYYSHAIKNDQEILLFQKKIEQSPLKEHLVQNLEDYVWSSYKIHIGLEPNYGLQDVLPFWALGNTPFERQRHWKNIVLEKEPHTLRLFNH